MNNRSNTIKNDELKELRLQQKVEKALSKKLNIPTLKSGNVVIRDENNNRINEKEIDYCWLINVSKSFVGWCWIFSIKFNQNQFRENYNSEKIIQGVFTIDENVNIDKIYSENRESNFKDKLTELKTYDLFNVNSDIVLDGVSYKYLIYTNNAQIKFELNNPNSKEWKDWKAIVDELGKELSEKTGDKEVIKIFN